MKAYLRETSIIDWRHPEVYQLALKLKESNPKDTAQNCFNWVRDHILHSSDYQMNPLTCKASEVLRHKTGYCFAKSHLLAALLRGNSLPAGFCYQRLSVFDDGAPYSLHGFNGVYLAEYGWYRFDARGNKPGVDAQFTPPLEKLAFSLNFPEEVDCLHIFAEPLPLVVKALQTNTDWKDMLHDLPDVPQDYLKDLNREMPISNCQ